MKRREGIGHAGALDLEVAFVDGIERDPGIGHRTPGGIGHAHGGSHGFAGCDGIGRRVEGDLESVACGRDREFEEPDAPFGHRVFVRVALASADERDGGVGVRDVAIGNGQMQGGRVAGEVGDDGDADVLAFEGDPRGAAEGGAGEERGVVAGLVGRTSGNQFEVEAVALMPRDTGVAADVEDNAGEHGTTGAVGGAEQDLVRAGRCLCREVPAGCVGACVPVPVGGDGRIGGRSGFVDGDQRGVVLVTDGLAGAEHGHRRPLDAREFDGHRNAPGPGLAVVAHGDHVPPERRVGREDGFVAFRPAESQIEVGRVPQRFRALGDGLLVQVGDFGGDLEELGTRSLRIEGELGFQDDRSGAFEECDACFGHASLRGAFTGRAAVAIVGTELESRPVGGREACVGGIDGPRDPCVAQRVAEEVTGADGKAEVGVRGEDGRVIEGDLEGGGLEIADLELQLGAPLGLGGGERGRVGAAGTDGGGPLPGQTTGLAQGKVGLEDDLVAGVAEFELDVGVRGELPAAGAIGAGEAIQAQVVTGPIGFPVGVGEELDGLRGPPRSFDAEGPEMQRAGVEGLGVEVVGRFGKDPLALGVTRQDDGAIGAGPGLGQDFVLVGAEGNTGVGNRLRGVVREQPYADFGAARLGCDADVRELEDRLGTDGCSGWMKGRRDAVSVEFDEERALGVVGHEFAPAEGGGHGVVHCGDHREVGVEDGPARDPGVIEGASGNGVPGIAGVVTGVPLVAPEGVDEGVTVELLQPQAHFRDVHREELQFPSAMGELDVVASSQPDRRWNWGDLDLGSDGIGKGQALCSGERRGQFDPVLLADFKRTPEGCVPVFVAQHHPECGYRRFDGDPVEGIVGQDLAGEWTCESKLDGSAVAEVVGREGLDELKGWGDSQRMVDAGAEAGRNGGRVESCVQDQTPLVGGDQRLARFEDETAVGLAEGRGQRRVGRCRVPRVESFAPGDG